MNRTLTYLCGAVAAIALTLPGAAVGNDLQLTEEGSPVTSLTTFQLTDYFEFQLVDTNSTSLVTCSAGELSGTIQKNSSSTVEAQITSASFSGTGAVSADNGLNECTGSFGNVYITFDLPMCLRSTPAMAEDELQINGGTCGVGSNVKLIVGSTTAGACEYESATSFKGDATTGGTGAHFTVRNTAAGSGMKLIKGGFLCPTSIKVVLGTLIETKGSNKQITAS
jgi:hypothetical protein